MRDLHEATIQYLKMLLKSKQRQLARAAHTSRYAELEVEFENLRNRLCLEIVYAMHEEWGEAGEWDQH